MAMSLRQFFKKSSNPRLDHDKAWKRAEATAWDEKWQKLSVEARRAYLDELKPPPRGIAVPQSGIRLEHLPDAIVKELVDAGFARVEAASSRKGAKIVAITASSDFSLRLRTLQRSKLLGQTNRTLLLNYVRYAFINQGEGIIARVLAAIKTEDHCTIDEALELYVMSGQWPDWALKAIVSKSAAAVLEALRKADGPVRLVDLPGLVKGLHPKDVKDGLTDLIVHLVAFEDLKPETLEILVGLLPIVRDAKVSKGRSDRAVALEAVANPREIGPPGGLLINDLRVFLLELSGEPVRLKQDGSLFAKEEPRFLAAFPPLPAWLETLLKLEPERRLFQAYRQALMLGFTEAERDDKAIWLSPNGRGKKWLMTGLEEQYKKLFEVYRSDPDSLDFTDFDTDLDDEDDEGFGYSRFYNEPYGDSLFYGVSVSIHKPDSSRSRYYSYYSAMDPKVREALRVAVREAFESLPVGVYHRWENVLDYLTTAKRNPLTLGGDPTKMVIFLDQRQIARLPEPILQASRRFLSDILIRRLIPLDAFRPALDDEGKLCVARLPRFSGFFGRAYDPGKDEVSASSKVIVQPDFSVLVIGLDPAPAVELAPFCERAGGHAGQGALTFKITRESVVRAAMQGLNASAIQARLKKYATIAVPANVISEINEWAGWVREVNVRPVTVVRCPDALTASRVLAALGKKAERLGETLVALHTPKLAGADRQKLQDQGILITKHDIVVARQDVAVARTDHAEPASPPASTKKRGRPKKVR